MGNVDLEKLFEGWEHPPKIYGVTFQERLEMVDPARTGYPGPRARLPLPARPGIGYEYFVEEAIKERRPEKVIFCYPTRLDYMRQSQQRKYPWYKKMPAIDDSIGLVDMSESMGKIAKRYPETYFEYLPLIKLTEGSVMSLNYLNPIRLWTHKEPEKDALYVFFDDRIQKGKTPSAAHSLLHHYGVKSKNIIFTGGGGSSFNITLTTEQKKDIKMLREDYPKTAAQADVILKLIGIDRMEALTRKEAETMEIRSLDYRSAYCKNKITQYLKGLCKYYMGLIPPIPEPTPEFIAAVTELGFAPEPPRSRRR